MEKPNKELKIERVFDAPIDVVFNAWMDPEKVVQWWAPNGATNRINTWDTKPGGKIDLVMMAGPEMGPFAGEEWPMNGEFTEVDPNSKISFSANAIMKGEEVMQNFTTVTFEEVDGKTHMQVHVKVTKILLPQAEGALAGMEMGWNQQLDKLGKFLER